MKISAQEEYGLRCLLQLALSSSQEGTTVKEIARLEGLSPAYVEKLMRTMGKAGLIHSLRGTKGGYRLNRPAAEIGVGEVVRALGSVPSTTQICDRFTGQLDSCVHMDNCCIRSVWATLNHAIQNFLDNTYLSDLMGGEAHALETMGQRMSPIQIHTGFSTDKLNQDKK